MLRRSCSFRNRQSVRWLFQGRLGEYSPQIMISVLEHFAVGARLAQVVAI